MGYLKHLIFYILEFTSALINLLSSFLGIYPKLELGMSFLLRSEGTKILRQDVDRGEKREDYKNQAEKLLEEAKTLSDG